MNNLQLLLVEDEVIIAENIRQSLVDLGYECVTVCNTFDDAIEVIEKGEIDLAIMDINLDDAEGRTGLDLASRLKKVKPTPFVFITAYSDKETVESASKLGPSAYLVKPVNDKTIFSTIQIAMQNFNSNQTPIHSDSPESPAQYFFTKIGNKTFKIFWSEVYLIRAIKNYVEIKAFGYTQTFLIRTSLTNCLESILPDNQKNYFVRINRAEAIRSEIVRSYDNQKIYTNYGEFKLSSDHVIELQGKMKNLN